MNININWELESNRLQVNKLQINHSCNHSVDRLIYTQITNNSSFWHRIKSLKTDFYGFNNYSHSNRIPVMEITRLRVKFSLTTCLLVCNGVMRCIVLYVHKPLTGIINLPNNRPYRISIRVGDTFCFTIDVLPR